ncbi:hypothetical protein EGW08_003117 [Elysia chlorotica]|uniref:Ubiquitin-like domain-containing protein n=1 Tax=Elysia chlorotica TaxID=188477 RepID=A0A3S0ZXG9_ELYCH|nr:hypothetical protein EGW08_003117 [Elysia chlorotica]
MCSLPPLDNTCLSLIRPLKASPNEPPLKLKICHGNRTFPVTLRIADNENGARISMRHLAEVVLHQTGIIPREQRYCFRGITWENPDLGPWSPGLRDLGLKNGDKVQLVSFHHSVPDWESVSALACLEKRFSCIVHQIHDAFHRLNGVHQGYIELGNQLMALAEIRLAVDNAKDKLLILIKDLNALNLDYRNYDCQARRREAVDSAQRQVDKCGSLSSSIFHKLAQSQSLSRSGPLYAGDPLRAMKKPGRL